jgi:hypothetical protein
MGFGEGGNADWIIGWDLGGEMQRPPTLICHSRSPSKMVNATVGMSDASARSRISCGETIIVYGFKVI